MKIVCNLVRDCQLRHPRQGHKWSKVIAEKVAGSKNSSNKQIHVNSKLSGGKNVNDVSRIYPYIYEIQRQIFII